MVALLWQGRLNEYDALVDEAIVQRKGDDDELALLWLKMQRRESDVLRSFISGETDEALASVEVIESSAIAAKGKRKSPSREYVECVAMHAEACLARALLLAKTRQWLRLLVPVRSAWKLFAEANELIGQMAKESDLATLRERGILQRVSLGYGLFEFGVALLPPTFNWVASALGFDGDKAKAKRALVAAAKGRNSPRWVHARLVLSSYLWFFANEEKKSMAIVEQLRKELAPSPMLSLISGLLARRNGKLDDASAHLAEAVKSAGELPQMQVTARYELSVVHWLRGDYERAASLIEHYLAHTTNKNFRAFGSYKLGFCYDALGRADAAEKTDELFRGVPALVDKRMSHDRYALRKSRERLEFGRFDEFERLSQPAYAAIVAMDYARALDAVECLVAVVKDRSVECFLPLNDRLAFCFFVRASAHAGLGNLKDAAADFQNLFQLKDAIAHETWTYPYGLVTCAEMLIDRGAHDKASVYLERARAVQYTFDLDKPLAFRIKRLLSRVAKQ
jgi:tetratricopeptide (TPR) repeat protein